MANVYQSYIIEGIVEYLNEYAETLDIPSIAVETLSTSQDNIALSCVSGNGSVESLSDVTGTAFTGVLNITIRYRVMQSVLGSDDLSYEDTLNAIYELLRNNRRSITFDNAFIDDVRQTSCGHLAVVYDGGVKDYESNITINYERW